ncbi:MAG: serine/threonine protein kinase, partial [Myxococcales bacterium]
MERTRRAAGSGAQRQLDGPDRARDRGGHHRRVGRGVRGLRRSDRALTLGAVRGPSRLGSAAMSLKAGDQLDRYKLVAPVGEGGQGSVWKAIDEGGDRLVALKLHRLSRDQDGGSTRLPSQESEETHRERLRREAQALRQLDHPSLVRCLGMFEDYERDVLGLVLEWIEGSTLTVAARAPTMTDEHRMWVLGHLVRALAYMHQSGMVHRDLKFSNVLVSPMFWQYPSEPATIKLVDLGVAAPVGNPDPLTRAGGVVGTVAYLAPERIVPTTPPARVSGSGLPTGAATPRSTSLMVAGSDG